MTDMQLKRAQLSDIEPLVTFFDRLDRALPPSPLDALSDKRAAFNRQLAEQLTGSTRGAALIGYLEQQAVGVICGHLHENPQLRQPIVGVVYNLWVEPASRRQGLGNALADRIEAELKQLGAQNIQVAWRQDAAAAAFWQQRGFIPFETIAAKVITD